MYHNIFNQFSDSDNPIKIIQDDEISHYYLPQEPMLAKTAFLFNPAETTATYSLEKNSQTFNTSYTNLNSLNISSSSDYTNNKLLNDYFLIKDYEAKYFQSSEEILNSWKDGKLALRNSEINNWLETYMQIRPFVYYDNTRSSK